MGTIRLTFWLLTMDAFQRLGLFGSRPYLWAVGRASDATDWGHGFDHGEGEPF
jgi:hypothetical protein